jgi:hypothetical protein
MGFFNKNISAEKILIEGTAMACDICQQNKFFYQESQLDTRLASLLKADFANKKAHYYA